MQSDQLDGLIALKLVAERRNFTAAATELGVSASAVSQAIKQLEGRLGVALLSRTTRSTSLTEAGEQFLAQAGPALDQILSALANVGTYAQKPSGLLRLNMPRMIYPWFLAPIIASFRKKFPEVAVELFFEDATSDVIGQGFDAGIRLSDVLAKDMVAMKLVGPVRFVPVASPKYLNKAGRPKHPKDLLGHECIVSRITPERIYDRWEFENKGTEFQVQVKPALIFNDSVLALRAALDGLGIMYAAEEAVSDQLSSGKLELVLNQYSTTSAGFYLYYSKRSQVLPKLRAFIDHLKAEGVV
ncbi:LysR substrate-binding domain-containing protein [Bdellovibrio bacteriovorus]|uniref:Transcriptional regulator, LysR family n=1 Tax=Bdellovibrio bacteriovorus (strain ATCC 15356 / DSM 50701 / NCIMB 9529 / HD100) TaxID=264462 RepID=Q6MPF3_BDEBA|nr:LysR family transcriptional regulator [Bdellovibrio bacteriovorus]AHZ86160.1 LysR family transcriptional regulator [Bdellovibrio bacteriovorus]BEV67395.1 HTH-type transcriptional regulator PgrR [Bdellovibrio bacteriovorus]CAE78845.1 transcriptional regulator, LysR family [Bdellovibrio bacteriovorus HD100]